MSLSNIDEPAATSRDGRLRPEMRSTLKRKRPHLFIVVFSAWAAVLAALHPRMWSLTEIAEGPIGFASIAYFVIFAEIAWLYGLYNVSIVAFAAIYEHKLRASQAEKERAAAAEFGSEVAPIAVLYTTCNDFVERSAQSCVDLDYPNFTLYMLDDSSAPESMAQVDAFAARFPDRVKIVRRADRQGFKAGNLNNALNTVVSEPFFAVVDADEILPRNFLSVLLPRLLADPQCGFIQANHRSRPNPDNQLARDMGVGVDIHWKWYQPLRNEFGFVMFLGHGALLRTSCWRESGGFPELVSEDLAYAIAIREKGYHGEFAEDVICLEEFPETVRAFRIRHVKWTRGTCEFLHHWMAKLIRARNVTTAEKLDILFPTLNLPLTFFFFIFMLNAQFLFPFVLGHFANLTLVVGGREIVVPMLALDPEITRIFGWDFFAITLLTIVAPVLCFIVELSRTPIRLFRFLTHSAVLYAALSPLSFVSVVGYAATRKARFLVTGDAKAGGHSVQSGDGFFAASRRFFSETHPDSPIIRSFEVTIGIVFLVCAIISVQVSFVGLALAFMLLPTMHVIGWDNAFVRRAVWAPFPIILSGVSLGVMGVAGLQPIFFGFGFHF